MSTTPVHRQASSDRAQHEAPRSPMHRTGRALLHAATLALLLLVFALYLQPDFLRSVADQVWACF